jgi:hypothetical protein
MAKSGSTRRARSGSMFESMDEQGAIKASGPDNLQELFNLKRFFKKLLCAGADAVTPERAKDFHNYFMFMEVCVTFQEVCYLLEVSVLNLDSVGSKLG